MTETGLSLEQALETAAACLGGDDLERAERTCRAILASFPAQAEAHHMLGLIAARVGRAAEGLPHFLAALAADPENRRLHRSAVEALAQIGDVPGMIEDGMVGRVLALVPGSAAFAAGLGRASKSLGRLAWAEDSLRHALGIDPGLASARMTLALVLFAQGNPKAAWPEFEARWITDEACRRKAALFSQPRWRGERLKRETLLVWGEQGIGDEILGMSMLPDALARAPTCLVECDSRLVGLLRRSFPAARFVARLRPPPLEVIRAERQVPLTGLGALFRTGLAAFPGRRGYLKPEPGRRWQWREWLDRLGPGRKIGLSWRGRLVSADRSLHFVPLRRLEPILSVPGTVFVNLQYDGFTDEIEALRAETGRMIHCPPDLDLTNDFDGVAALMAELDAVVAPATAVAMLAGAVGRPTWMYALFPHSNEKEVMGQDRVPWCPSVKVFACSPEGGWEQAIERIAGELASRFGSPHP